VLKLTDKPLDPEAITSSVRQPANGAVVTFLGTTRNANEGRRVLYLEYEAYKKMALKKLQELCQEVESKWGISDVAIVHRLGRVDIGEISLAVAVASPHREEAFQACQYIVGRVKQVVPIWKKEYFEGGEVWIGSEGVGISVQRKRRALAHP
jgi:molybdopterin synthase catalytic subunit